MAVLLDSEYKEDFSVGIAAMSRHQGWWNHSPGRPFVEDPDEEFVQWLTKNLGQGASRRSRRPLMEQFTGHTAVLSRVAGRVEFVRGLVPNLSGYIWAFFGQGGGGHWQNDMGMLGDPTCVSFEVPVSKKEAKAFPGWFNRASTVINIYALRQGDAITSFNCVLAAVTVMVNYLLESNDDHSAYVEQLLKIRDSLQGHLMQDIASGFQ